METTKFRVTTYIMEVFRIYLFVNFEKVGNFLTEIR